MLAVGLCWSNVDTVRTLATAIGTTKCNTNDMLARAQQTLFSWSASKFWVLRFAVPKQRRYRYGEDFLFFEHGLCVVFVKRVVRERGRGLGRAESRKSKEKVLVLK